MAQKAGRYGVRADQFSGAPSNGKLKSGGSGGSYTFLDSESIEFDTNEDEVQASLKESLLDKVNNSLQITEETEEVLVGVNSDGEQTSVEIGEGLAIENGVIKNTRSGSGTTFIDSEEIVFDVQEDGVSAALANDVSNRIAKSLVTPVSTPTERLLPTITTSNAQENIGIGDGLTVEGGKLKATGGGGGGSFYLHTYRFGTSYSGRQFTAHIMVKRDVSTPFSNFTDLHTYIRSFASNSSNQFLNVCGTAIETIDNVQKSFPITSISFTSTGGSYYYDKDEASTLRSFTLSDVINFYYTIN